MEPRDMRMVDPVRVAVVGVGGFGECHARTLAALPEARLVALVNRTREKAERLAAELAVPHVFTTVEELLQADVTDAVIISTRTDTHVPFSKTALSAGLHVLVEKPVGTSLQETQQLLELGQSADRVVMAGHICMFHSLINPLVERVRREGFRSAHFVRHRPARLARLFPEEHPISLIMVHDLYVAAQMVNGEDPFDLEGLEAANSEGRTDHSWATLRWRDGRVATFHSHLILPAGDPEDGFDALEVFGDNSHTRVETNPQSLFWSDEKMTWPFDLEISTVDGRPTGMLAEELRSFLAACQGAPITPGCRMQDALQVQRWMETLMRSAASRRLV